MKKIIRLILVALLILTFGACGKHSEPVGGSYAEPGILSGVERALILSYGNATLDGEVISEDNSGPVFISHDIIYYEDRDRYDSGNPYGEGRGDERHTAREAAENTVVNISEPGIYRVSGTLCGQLRVDLGKSACDDPDAAVTLILDGTDINCAVAPGVIFTNVYECGEDRSPDTASAVVDTSNAGANIIIAQGSINNVNGGHVAKIYKDTDSHGKLWKQDGAIYSYMSMNISADGDGSGILNIIGDNEGIGSELHLTINSGNINIYSADDAINTNESGVSVTTINGGNIHLIGGLDEEGDGIDSNGYLVINGGVVVASANPISDCGLDSDLGSFINGGTVIAMGCIKDRIESGSDQSFIELRLIESRNAESLIEIKNEAGKVIFSCDLSGDEALAGSGRKFTGAMISAPELNAGENYTVWIDGVLEQHCKCK